MFERTSVYETGISNEVIWISRTASDVGSRSRDWIDVLFKGATASHDGFLSDTENGPNPVISTCRGSGSDLSLVLVRDADGAMFLTAVSKTSAGLNI